MPKRKRPAPTLSKRDVPRFLIDKVRPPLAVVLGSPAEVVNLLSALPRVPTTCYQMDLHQADRLREGLAQEGIAADVVAAADLWDLPADFHSAVYLPARGGERELKIDMVEQAYHILRDRGTFLVWSPYQGETLFPGLLKKVFGKTHTPPHDKGGDTTSLSRDATTALLFDRPFLEAMAAGADPIAAARAVRQAEPALPAAA